MEEKKEIKLGRWNPHFPSNFSMIISASRRSGKTFLFKHLYLNYIKTDKTIIFSPNLEQFNFVPKGSIMKREIDENILNYLMNRKGREKLVNVLVVFDDLCSKKNKGLDSILQLYTQGRHNNVSVVFITQNITLCDTTWRNCTDLFIIMKNKTSMQYDTIINNFLLGYIEVPEAYEKKERTYMRKLLYRYLKGPENVFNAIIMDDSIENGLFIYRAPSKNKKISKKEKKKNIELIELEESSSESESSNEEQN